MKKLSVCRQILPFATTRLRECSFCFISSKNDLIHGAEVPTNHFSYRTIAPQMLARRSGSIINMLDLSALQTWPNSSHHSTTKAGLLALTRAMAFELAPWIRVNGVAPGSVLLPEECSREKEEGAVNNSLLKRIESPEDVAKTVIFLLESEFITGAVYFVDGGRSVVSSSMADHGME